MITQFPSQYNGFLASNPLENSAHRHARMVRPIRVLIGAPRATLQRLRIFSYFQRCSRMDTLMRTLKLLALGVLFIAGTR